MRHLRAAFWLAIATSHAVFLLRPIAGSGDLTAWSALALAATIAVAVFEAIGRGPTRFFRIPATPRAWTAAALLLLVLHIPAIERACSRQSAAGKGHSPVPAAMATIALATLGLRRLVDLAAPLTARPDTARPRPAAGSASCIAVPASLRPEAVWWRERLALAPPARA